MKIWESQCAVSKKCLVKCFNVNKYDSETDQFEVSWSAALIAKQQSQCRKCLSWTTTSNNQHDWTPLKYVNILHMIVTIWRNLRRLSASGKSTLSFRFFLIYYFGYIGHACLHTPKITVSNCRKPQCLSACQKRTLSFIPFLRYYILKYFIG